MINWTRVNQLITEIGKEDFADIVAIFLEEMDEGITRLVYCPDDQLADTLHFLKGSALNLGFSEFGELCQFAETAIKTGMPVDRSEIAEGFTASRQVFVDGLSLVSAA